MYANRYVGSGGFKPISLGASLLINAAVIVALIYAAPSVIPIKHAPLRIDFLPIDRTPPPPPIRRPKPHPLVARPTPAPLPTASKPIVDMPINPTPIDLQPLQPPPDPGPLGDGGTGVLAPTPMPPLVGAAVDPRYAGDFQPIYPPAERRANREGHVVVRVLIGVDGRVKQVEQVSATSDAFFAATRDRALAKWRFKPATRGDVPVEAWRTMSVSFVLRDA
jgi:protein TonB